MRPIGYIDGTAAGPDPVAAPGNVTDLMILDLPTVVPGSNHAPDRTLLWTTGAGGNVTGQLYAMDESTAGLAAASRVWRKIGDALTIAVDAVKELEVTHGAAVANLMIHGKVYFRVTAGNGAGMKVFIAVV